MEAIAALAAVAWVSAVPSDSAAAAIEAVQPYRYVKSPDYRARREVAGSKLQREIELTRSCGGDIVYTDDEQFSSSSLIYTFFSPYSTDTRNLLSEIKKGVATDDVDEIFSSLEAFNGSLSVPKDLIAVARKFFPKARVSEVHDTPQEPKKIIPFDCLTLTLHQGIRRVVIQCSNAGGDGVCIPLSSDDVHTGCVELLAQILNTVHSAKPSLMVLLLVVFGQEHNRLSSRAGLKRVIQSTLT